MSADHSAAAELAAFGAEFGAPERVELILCDLNGVLRGKWLPPEAINKLDKGAVRLPISAHAPSIMGYDATGTGLGIEVGDPDGALTPVAGTMKPVPWAATPAAQMLCDMNGTDGAPSYLSTRRILQTVVDRFAARGLTPVVAVELEFYVMPRRANAEDPPEPPARTPDAQNYDLETLSRHEELIRALVDAAAQQDLPTDALIAEFGPGQFEINFHHTDNVLKAADDAVFFKRMVREVAAKQGLEATFMAKPYADHPGNGMHVHMSLLDREGRNVFAAAREGEVAPTLRHAVAGLLETMRDMQAIFAPHMNSYRRFQKKAFAPSTPDWGVDNRAAGVRLPDTFGPAARFEHRICGADVNLYLALAGILGGALHGLEAGVEPPPPLDDPNAEPAEPLCPEWTVAVDRFAQSSIASEILGAEFRDVYAAVRRGEIEVLTRILSPVEYRYYLSRL